MRGSHPNDAIMRIFMVARCMHVLVVCEWRQGNILCIYDKEPYQLHHVKSRTGYGPLTAEY